MCLGKRSQGGNAQTMSLDTILLDEFTIREFKLNYPLLIVYLSIGFIGIYIESPLFALIYLLFIIFPFYLANRYFACSKCYYYGKSCYLFGGQCSAALFEKREGEYTKFESTFVGMTWMITIIYPLYWLARPVYNSPQAFNIIYLITFLITSVSWQVIHSKTCCTRCKNLKCALNRARR